MDYKDADSIDHVICGPENGTKLLRIGVLLIPPGAEMKIHSHRDQELAYIILSGKALVTVGDEQAEVGPHDVVWIPIKTPHGAKNIGEGNLRYISAGWTV